MCSFQWIRFGRRRTPLHREIHQNNTLCTRTYLYVNTHTDKTGKPSDFPLWQVCTDCCLEMLDRTNPSHPLSFFWVLTAVIAFWFISSFCVFSSFSFCTPLPTGITPIITSSMAMQLMAGAQMIDVNQAMKEDRALFGGAQKVGEARQD